MQNATYDRLRKNYPWPTGRPLSRKDAFDWSLTNSGRDLLASAFQQRPPRLMVEIGSFMGGSALQWLRLNPQLRLVCVDPFPDNYAAYVRSLIDAPWAANYGKDNLLRYTAVLARRGTIKVVQNNLWDFRDRVVLVRKEPKDAVAELEGLNPDLVFMGAAKTKEEFALSDRLFPDAIIAGDGWNWTDKKGDAPIPRLAGSVAKRRGANIHAKASTFIISEPGDGIELPQLYLQSIPTDERRTRNPYAEVYEAFPAWEGVVPAGYHAGWLGNFGLIETFYPGDSAYLETLKRESQQRAYRKTQKPKPTSPIYYETGAVLRAVLRAGKSFRMMELGSGIGPWTVLAAKGAEYRGIKERLFVPVEAEPTRFQWLQSNMEFNDIAANERAPMRAVVFPSDKQDTEVFFPVGAAHFAGHSATTDASVKESTVEYGGRRENVRMEAAPVVSLRSLLETHGGVFDLIHMDVQGVEYSVVKHAADLLNASVRSFCIETHSAQIDSDLQILFKSLGWECLMSWGFWENFEIEGETISARGLGGFQHWINPALACVSPSGIMCGEASRNVGFVLPV